MINCLLSDCDKAKINYFVVFTFSCFFAQGLFAEFSNYLCFIFDYVTQQLDKQFMCRQQQKNNKMELNFISKSYYNMKEVI